MLPQLPDALVKMDALAHRLLSAEQHLERYPAFSSADREERSRLMDLVHFHQHSLIEWLSPQGEALAVRDPHLFAAWEQEVQWLLSRLAVTLAA